MKCAQSRGNLGFLTAVSQGMETKIMKRFLQITLVLMTLCVASCADNTYPISGETCGPDDPVRTLDAKDCTALPGG